MKLILFTAFIIFSLSSFAQTEPLIELIFEDTIGNKDTTIIGISELACDTMLSSFLGEERINAQLNDSSTFEVIGAKVKQTDIYTSHFLFREELFLRKYFSSFLLMRRISLHTNAGLDNNLSFLNAGLEIFH